MDAVKQPRRCPAPITGLRNRPLPAEYEQSPESRQAFKGFFGPRGTNLSMAARMIRCKPESRISKSNPIRPHRNAQKLHSQRLAVQYAVTIEIDDRWLRSPQMRSKRFFRMGKLQGWSSGSSRPQRLPGLERPVAQKMLRHSGGLTAAGTAADSHGIPIQSRRTPTSFANHCNAKLRNKFVSLPSQTKNCRKR